MHLPIDKFKKLLSNKMMFSYFIVLALPIVFSIIAYNSLLTVVTDNINESNVHILNNYASYIDSITNRITSEVPTVFTDEELTEFGKLSQGTTTQFKFELANSNYDRRILSFSDYLKNYYIYFPESNMIFTLGGFMDTDRFFDAKYMESMLSEDDWVNDILLSNSVTLVPLVSNENKTSIFFTYPLTDKYTGVHIYTIVAELNIDRMATECTLDNGFVICDNKGNLVSGRDNKFMKYLSQIDLFNNASAGTELDIQGTDYVFNSTKSGVLPICYVTITPKDEYWQERSNVWWFMSIAICFSILIGVIIILYIVKKNNEPIQKILKLFSSGTKESDTYYDSYRYLFDSVSNTLAENNIYATKIEEQSRIIKKNILTDILNGKVCDKDAYCKLLNLAGVNWDKECFAVIALLPNYQEEIKFKSEDTPFDDLSKKSAAEFITTRICYEIMLNWYTPEFFNLNNLIVCIINITKNESQYLNERLETIFNEALRIQKSTYGFEFIASVSSVKSNIDDLFDAYSEAVFSIEYASASNNNIVFYSNLNHHNVQSGFYTMETEQQIINCLEIENYEKCRQIVEKVLFKLELSNTSAESTLLFACDIINTFYNHNMQPNADNKAKSYLKQGLNEIMEKHFSKPSIILNTMTSIDKYISYIESSSQGGISGSALPSSNNNTKVREFIDSNYDDPELCVNKLGEIFGMNSSYLSKRFKEQHGIVPSDYIAKCRINAAKKLLKSTNKTNAEIAELVGYSNTRTFLRAFSGAEGMTPQKYRQSSAE